MITSANYCISSGYDPYENQALEEYLLEVVPENTIILYLWQNQRTVVIGQNQNAWQECRVEALESDGGKLARRLSGGGAVYHDVGNLNFTFLVRKEDYNLERQLQVILEAVRSLGLEAEKSGRNDITVNGKKFSGNAFYNRGGHCYHHGTILISVDTGKLADYLNVSAAKLQSKGVSSVKSRVANLCDFCPSLTPEAMRTALLTALEKVYGCKPLPLPKTSFEKERLLEFEGKYSSWDWRLGKKLEFTWEASRRFDWGEIQVQLKLQNGRVQQAVVYSDAMDAELIAGLGDKLVDCPFSAVALSERILANASPEAQPILADISAWLPRQI